MCFPPAILALIGAGVTAGGAGLASVGQNQAEDAKRRAFMVERQRQQGLTDQQNASFEDSLRRSADLSSDGAQEDAAAARRSVLTAAIAPQLAGGGDYLPGSSSAPSIVADASVKASAGATATSTQLARAIAALGGAQDQQQTANIAINRNAQDIGRIGSFKSGSAGVLDSELTAASHKGDFFSGLGGFVQQLGQAALLSGAGGAVAGKASSILPKGVFATKGLLNLGSAFGKASGLPGVY